MRTRSGSYDADVPNRTIYVSEDDQPLYQRAQELAGGNLSAAITGALKRYVNAEDARNAGFDEIVVKVGVGKKLRKVRFSGILVGHSGDGPGSAGRMYRMTDTGVTVVLLSNTGGIETVIDTVFSSVLDLLG